MSKDFKRYTIFYGIASVGLFVGPFFGNKGTAISLLIWLIATALFCSKTLFARHTSAELVDHAVNNTAPRLWKEKKYTHSALTFIAVPLMGAGLIIIAISVILLFFI